MALRSVHRSSFILRHGFTAFTLAALLVSAALFLIQATRSIGVPQDIQYPESAVLFGIVSLWQGGPLYYDFHQPPFAVIAYTPLFYLISAGLAKWLAHSTYEVYLTARAVALGATLLTALGAALIVRRAGGRPVVGLSTAALFLGSSLLLPWGYMARVDTLMLLFVALGLYAFVRWRGGAKQYLAIPFFVLALLSKQSALAAPAAAVLLLAWERQWRRAIIFGLGVGLLTAGIFALGDYATGGLMRLNTIDGLDAPVRLASVGEVLGRSLRGLLLPLTLAAVVVAAVVRSRRDGRLAAAVEILPTPDALYTARLGSLYLAGALALGALSSAKLGSDRNYYLEALLAASALGGLTIQWLAARSQQGWRYALAGAGLVLLLGLPDLSQKWEVATSGYSVSEDNSAVVALLRRLPGAVLVQDANPVLRADKAVYMTDSYHLAVLEARGRWHPGRLAAMVRQKEFQTVILSFDVNSAEKPGWIVYQGLLRLSPEVMRAVGEHYVLGEQLGSYYVYYPRGGRDCPGPGCGPPKL